MTEVQRPHDEHNPETFTAPVVVTGATGYVAGWVIRELLARGAHVRAAVRDSSNTSKVGHLTRMAEASAGTLEFFETDLLTPGSYREALEGAGVVFHTASPFIRHVRDAQRDLVDPAVQGTRNVLEAASDSPSLTRVVLTSSMAAMYGDAADLHTPQHLTLTEKLWNTTSSLTHEPYQYSKTLAEKEAWRIAKAQQRWDLVVINPAFVVGPALNEVPTSDSFSVIRQLTDGTGRFGVPRVSLVAVDVRDVALAHVRAALRPHAHGRYLIAAESTDTLDMSRRMLPAVPQSRRIARSVLPKSLAWLTGPMFGLDRAYVERNVNFPIAFDASKSEHELGITYRPIQRGLIDMAQQIHDPKRRARKRP